MKKIWEYKQKGLRSPMVSEKAFLKDGFLTFVVEYDKSGFYESRMIRYDLQGQEAEVIFTEKHVIRDTGIYLDGKFYFNSFGGKMYCIEEMGNSVLWETKFGKGNPDWHVGVDEGYFYTYNHGMFCLDKETGKIVWESSEASSHANCDILVRGDWIYHGLSDGFVYCMDKRDGSIRWKYGSNLYVRHCAFAGESGLMACDTKGDIFLLDIRDGSLISKTATAGAIYCRPVFEDGYVYVGNDKGEMYCLKAEENSGFKEVFRFQAEEKVTAPAVIDGNSLWFAVEGSYLYKLDKLTGEELAKKKKTAGTARWISPYEGGMLVLSDKGQLEFYA